MFDENADIPLEGLKATGKDYALCIKLAGQVVRCFGNVLYKCDNARLQLKKSKRITVRHFYSLVPMSVVSSPKATSKESSPGAPKVFR